MRPDASLRAVPITRLRQRYRRLGQRGVSTRQRHEECDQLTTEVTPLLCEFLEAVHLMERYDNRREGFYPSKGRLSSEDRHRDAGTVVVTNRLRKGPVVVPALAPYVFRYLQREVNPLRTTRGRFVDGTPATRSGKGGIDYLALLEAD